MSEKLRSPREIVLINKSEASERDGWDIIERISKILSIAAIPIVIAVGGWYIQKQLQNQTVSRDYVQLAVSILKEPDQSKIKPELRSWAVDLLSDNSPTKLKPDVIAKLKSGEILLPSEQLALGARPFASLCPKVANIARQLIEQAKQQGIDVKVVRTYVTPEEQDRAVAEGRAFVKSSQSNHVKGLAFDIVPYVNGQIVWDDIDKVEKLKEIGRNLGLSPDEFEKGHGHFAYITGDECKGWKPNPNETQ
jgi:hypothetical protein